MSSPLRLIPPPRECRLLEHEQGFLLDADTAVVLPAGASDRLRWIARELQDAVRACTALPAPCRVDLEPLAGANRIVLVVGMPAAEPPFTRLPELGREGYVLRIDARGVLVAGASEQAVFYGVQTLSQLLRTQGRWLPALEIVDWPVLPNRGVMLDVSRGKVPTRQTLYQLIDLLAHYKYNHFQLYVEHTYHFTRHPEISAGSDPLTSDDIVALDRYARQRFVELVPNFQSFGHQRRLLSLPRYTHLDEVGWRWSLTPAREETYQLLDELYAEFLPNFSSTWFNVDCDETWDLGTGQARELARQLGKGRLYLRHILRLRELAARYGRRIMIWADILLHYPELVNELPEDVLLLDWHYEAQEQYPSAALLGSLGRTFWVCPGTSSWNTLFPRIENAIGNIRGFVRDGIAAGASGMLLTDWGDYGHYQPLSLSLYPYLFGAAVAWSGPDCSLEAFDAAFAPLAFQRPSGDASVAALRELGRAVTAPTLGLPNRSNAALALFDEPLAGSLIANVDPVALEQLREAASRALTAWASLPDPALRWDYTAVARLVVFAADKLRASQLVRASLAALAQTSQPSARDRVLADFDAAVARLTVHRERLPALAAEFAELWLRHARRSELQVMLDRFAALEHRYEAALAWLAEQRGRALAGEPVDAALAGYDAGDYRALWEEGFVALLELAQLVGVDELPPDVRRWLEQAGVIVDGRLVRRVD